MKPIEKAFNQKQAFVGYVVGGDGGVDYCVDCCLQMIEGGVDILEIGMPFSDPVADGPVIQRAAQRSLEQGTTSETILEIGRRIRKETDTPLILFSYYNPLLKKGEAFLKTVEQAGFDAVLVVDLPTPIDQPYSHPYYTALKQAGMDSIFLVSPSTDDNRLSKIAQQAQGFLYYACQKGTTGVRKHLPEDVSAQIARIRHKSKLPIVVGFGIADRSSAKAVLDVANGFVVGSAFVQLMEKRADPRELKCFAQGLDPRW